MHQHLPLARRWRAVGLAALLLVSSPWVLAQWQWVDGTGRKVFSDTAPPSGIPEKNILRSPATARAPVPAPAASAPAAAASQPGGAPVAATKACWRTWARCSAS